MLKKILNRLAGAGASAKQAEAGAEEVARQSIAAGNEAEDAGRLHEALDLYRRAIAAAPMLPAAHLNLGIGLAAAGDSAGAEHAYQQVLALERAHPFGCYNYALLCYRRGELERAAELAQAAVRAKPDLYQAHLLLSNVFDDQGRADAAVRAAREALACAPQYAGAHYNLALLLQKAGDLEDALQSVQRAVALEANRPDFHALHAQLLARHGFMSEALAAIRAARRLGARETELTASRELFYANYDEGVDPAELFALHRDYGRMLEAAPPEFEHVADPTQQDRRLRVGYVSGDFCTHPVALFLLPVLEGHDRTQFEVFCYATGDRSDHVTARLKEVADHWADVRELDDAALARRIHADRIDILLDLSGHSGVRRLGAFARKPAPVQASWLGYLNTTGLTRIDWRICDDLTDPTTVAQPLHSEKLLHLPDSQWCYRPFLDVPGSAQPPCATNGYITFGSFNQAGKITVTMVQRWAAILQRVPRSRLLLADVSSRLKRDAILSGLRDAGVAEERIEFVPRLDLEAYYRLFERADIALDTWPYTGGTTTFDAVLHGVPVVTARGPSSFSRSASSILERLGLHDWVAGSIDGYVDIAVQRAGDPALATLRKELPRRLAASPMTDEPRFVRDLERLYRQAWRFHCGAQ